MQTAPTEIPGKTSSFAKIESVPINFEVSNLYARGAFALLLATVFIGFLASLQYILPDRYIAYIPFQKTRPIHTTLAVFWLFTGAMGCIYYFLTDLTQGKLYSNKIAKAQFYIIFLGLGLIILSYVVGIFGGREYFEFSPIFAIFILIGFGLYGYNFYKTITGRFTKWPVYLWMWTTGIIFFMITFAEGYLPILSLLDDNYIRDITIQWKALGALVGSWNMLIYGIGIYVLDQLKPESRVATGKLTFFFYGLGLVNLMFGWAHHTYHVPHAVWLKQFAFILNMAELIIFAKILKDWLSSFKGDKRQHSQTGINKLSLFNKWVYADFILNGKKLGLSKLPLSYFLVFVTDFWVILNLALAILISVPQINTYVHGTHVIVAHAMGSTIGINTMILLSAFSYIGERYCAACMSRKSFKGWLWLLNISLLIFFVSLILAGISRSLYTFSTDSYIHQDMNQHIYIYLIAFIIAGAGIMVSLGTIGVKMLYVFGWKTD